MRVTNATVMGNLLIKCAALGGWMDALDEWTMYIGELIKWDQVIASMGVNRSQVLVFNPWAILCWLV